jgi:two-component system LytT family sensor kinase
MIFFIRLKIISRLIISVSRNLLLYGIFFDTYLCDGQKRCSMKYLKSRRLHINLLISFVISLFMVLPMILGMMGYDIFNRRPAPAPAMQIPFWKLFIQWLFYFLMVFILMTINTVKTARLSIGYKLLSSLFVMVVFYFVFETIRPSPPTTISHVPGSFSVGPQMHQPVAPFPSHREGMPPYRPAMPFGLDYRRVTEFIFILIITTLLGNVFELVNVKQQIELENEQLRSENLQNRYDVLINQINPHFFFNSLNSLSSLVRDGRNDSALKYIDELSNTYRYAMQSSGKELVTVADELESLKAYSYLLQIRFENKLFIEINIDEKANKMLLPVLSLQPLIENVVKHNVISIDAPLTITIIGNEEGITVINPVRLRHDQISKSGIGLNNLSTRYKLLTGLDLIIENGSDIFSVTLPLKRPEE